MRGIALNGTGICSIKAEEFEMVVLFRDYDEKALC